MISVDLESSGEQLALWMSSERSAQLVAVAASERPGAGQLLWWQFVRAIEETRVPGVYRQVGRLVSRATGEGPLWLATLPLDDAVRVGEELEHIPEPAALRVVSPPGAETWVKQIAQNVVAGIRESASVEGQAVLSRQEDKERGVWRAEESNYQCMNPSNTEGDGESRSETVSPGVASVRRLLAKRRPGASTARPRRKRSG